MMKKNYKVLAPYVYNHRNGESEQAEAMFERFVGEKFSYDEISNHPDYMVYASAELLHEILPQMIDEMFLREDMGNFLVYSIISSLDPIGSSDIEGSTRPLSLERAKRVYELADKNFTEKALKFLVAMEIDPPNNDEQVQRLLSLWKQKAAELN